jgi:hypothetical protein
MLTELGGVMTCFSYRCYALGKPIPRKNLKSIRRGLELGIVQPPAPLKAGGSQAEGLDRSPCFGVVNHTINQLSLRHCYAKRA